jgi:hypothetical protein
VSPLFITLLWFDALRTTEWQWDSNSKKYEVGFKKGCFLAKEVGKADTEFVATYTALKLKMLGKYELPTLTFHTPGLSEDEMARLIFALLFNDIQLPVKKRPLVRVTSLVTFIC